MELVTNLISSETENEKQRKLIERECEGRG
jgi:hypothetical protein